MLNQKTNLNQIYLKGLNSMMHTTKTNKQTMSKKLITLNSQTKEDNFVASIVMLSKTFFYRTIHCSNLLFFSFSSLHISLVLNFFVEELFKLISHFKVLDAFKMCLLICICKVINLHNSLRQLYDIPEHLGESESSAKTLKTYL